MIRPPRVIPAKVRGGINAFLRACFQITATLDAPLARASLIYSVSSTSNMADRIRRRLAAMVNHPRVMAGSMMLLASSRPEGATQPSLTAKKNMSIMPIQKGGADWPIKATPLPIRSTILPRFSEESTPRGIPTARENRNAVNPRYSVAGNR